MEHTQPCDPSHLQYGTALEAQTKRDPRVVGMAGAYTTIANGIFSVGYNPGLIGLQQNRPFMLQIGQVDYGILGNFFSIQTFICRCLGFLCSRSL